jgi:hypothetical protein
LPGIAGNRRSRRVKSGTGAARESTIFCRINSRICPSIKDNIKDNYPLWKEIGLQNLREMRAQGYACVDKTPFVAQLADQGQRYLSAIAL